jgi:hypothetical protein
MRGVRFFVAFGWPALAGPAKNRGALREPVPQKKSPRRKLRAWSGPARGRPVVFGGARCAAWLAVKAPKKNHRKAQPEL